MENFTVVIELNLAIVYLDEIKHKQKRCGNGAI